MREARGGRAARADVPPLPDDQADAVQAVLDENHRDPARLLVILQDLQHRLGYVPAATVGPLAKALGLSRAEVHGVITFYHDLHAEPSGRHHLRVCQAESCQAAGGAAVWAHLESSLGQPIGATTADGALTTEIAYCLGLCAASPAVLYDERPIARVTVATLDRLVADARSQS